MPGTELSDVEFLREWHQYFGAGPGLRMLGFCLYWGAMGYRNFQALESDAERWGSRSSHFRAVSELRGFREYLRARGYDFAEVEDVARRAVATKGSAT
jgi:hypothetical protein